MDEMYRLELHLNECELCSDALEGIALVKYPDEVLKGVKDNVLPVKQKEFAINYMAIAASVALIAVFGFSYWFISNSSEDQNLALNTPIDEATKVEEPKVDLEETVESFDDDALAENIVVDPVSNTDQDNGSISTQEVPAHAGGQEIELANSSKPVARTDVNKAEKTSELVQDIEINSQEDVSNFALNDQVSGQEREPNAAQPSSATNRVLKEAQKKTSDQPVLKNQKEPTPKGGINALREHISNNLIYPQEAIDNKIKGNVVLEVTVAEDGSVKNLTVIKGLGFGCDVEAKRLLITGPQWTPKVVNGIAEESKREIKVKFKN